MSTFGYIQASFLFPTAKTGKMKVYIAGSLTPAVLYDPNDGNPISNVLDIDSNGYVRPFWVESSIVYDIYVFDSKNNAVDTIENVSVVGGSSGTPGTDGSSVFLTVNPDGSATITDDFGKTVTIRNGTNGTNGSNGSDGADGVSLISISSHFFTSILKSIKYIIKEIRFCKQ